MKLSLRDRNKNIPIIISVIFLFLAVVGSFPYGFYTLLRLVVCGATVYLAWLAYDSNKRVWIWPFGFIAVLFNPLIPIHFNRDLWRVIDLLVAIFLMISIFSFKIVKEKGTNNISQ